MIPQRLVAVSSEDFQPLVIENRNLTFVTFWDDINPDSKTLVGSMELLAERYQGIADFFLVNGIIQADLAQRFNVNFFPTTLLFIERKIVDTILGARTYERFEEIIELNLGKV